MTNPWTHMTRPALLALSASVLASTAVAVAGAGAATTKTVTLKNIAFSPKSLKVAKGTKVAFAFRDGATVHNVTSTGSTRFSTISNRRTGSKSRTFSKAGTYRYECTLHPGMTGRIVVR